MGREVRRVPLDFDWPLSQVWEGYLMPERLREPTCTRCGGEGKTNAAKWVDKLSYLLLMLPDEVPERKNPNTDSARTGRLHPWLQSLEFRPNVPPSADIAELTGGLAGRPPRQPFGHDAIDHWHAYDAIVKAAGLDSKVWGICPQCKGHGCVEAYEGQRAEAEAWQPTEPPSGDGWQLWETVSEGSPISPVFASADELAAWMSSPESGRDQVSPEVAANFVRDGWAPTFMSTPEAGLVSGVEYVGSHPRTDGED